MPAGTVTVFDAERGLGEVTADDGRVYPFHCVELADGTRTVEVGAAVTFTVRRKLGRLEAAAITLDGAG
jgi:CspA family cold shock protein